MQRHMLKSKIHRATITEADLNYEGSLTIDKNLLEAVGLHPYERVMVYNINNGERFDTYAIEGKPGSGVIGLNGAAARKGLIGDQIIIVSYAFFSEEELIDYHPKIVLLNKSNQIKKWLHK
ncbi:MAG: aspartate 1-decarboxylase [Deltaproteobacteria bacterium]|jgi:aspartate 1-decarboxylase|nr:aspartate 1-decarboxylase [Deltaproteobacteria bacterium]